MLNYVFTALFCALFLSTSTRAQNVEGERAWFLLDRIQRHYGKAISLKKKVTDKALLIELEKDIAELKGLLDKTSISPKDFIAKFDLKSPRKSIVEVSAELRSATALAFKLQLSPLTKPDLMVGEKLYKDSACSTCHGGLGKPVSVDLIKAMAQKPPDFSKSESVENLSPYGAFQVLSHKPRNNTMPDFSDLPTEQRWALAVFIFSLAPQDQDKEVKLKTKLNWQSQMSKNNAELAVNHPVNPWQLRKALLSVP